MILSLAALVLILGAPLPATASSRQDLPTGRTRSCQFEPVFRTPLHMLWQVPFGVNHVIIDGMFELIPPRYSGGADRYFLRDDRELGGRIALVPLGDIASEFRSLGRSLMGRHLEITGCLGDRRAPDPPSVIQFYSYAVIPEREKKSAPREVDLETLRDGAYDGQRVLLRGALAGRSHLTLPMSTRLAESDWVLASGETAAWMRGRPPEGDGFQLDPDDPSDQGRGLAVAGQLAWWHGTPVLYVEYVRMSGDRSQSQVAVLFTLPLDGQLDAADPRIEVRFNAAMDEGSFENRVELISAEGESFLARWAYDDDQWSLLVWPRAPLPPGAELELRLHDGIVSSDGWAVRRPPGASRGPVLVQTFRRPAALSHLAPSPPGRSGRAVSRAANRR